MKLFGPKSCAYIVHSIFKILNYIYIFFGILVVFHLLMAVIDYTGFSNIFASLEISKDSFKIHPKLFNDGSILIPIGGLKGFLNYVYMILSSFLIIILFTRFFSKIFLGLSQETVFVEPLVKNTKALAWLLIIMSVEKIVSHFYTQLTSENIIMDVFILFFVGIMIWFLSKIFEEGHKLQREIDLTI